MKSKLLVIVLLTLSLNRMFSQNLNRERERINYTRLPATPLPEDITRYYQNIDLGYLYAGDSKTEVLNSLSNAAVIPHLEKTADTGIEILTRLETYYKGETRFESLVKKEKRDDKEVSVTYYFVTFEYKYPLYFEIKFPEELEPLNGGFINGSNNMSVYKSAEYRSRTDLSKWWNDNYRTIQNNLRKKLLASNTTGLRNTLINLYSYNKVSQYVEFAYVKKHKKFEYPKIDEALEKAKIALASVEPNEIVFNDKFNASMEEATALWNSVLEESNLEDKKSRVNKKITEALYNNLFLGHILMNDFEKAKEIKTLAEEKLGKKAIENYSESLLKVRMGRFEANEGRIPTSI